MKTGVEQLTLDECLKYLRIMRARYQQADRQTKTALLDQMVAVTGLHRKNVLRQPGGDLQRHPRSTERGATYGPEVQAALAVIAESLDYVCAERRHPQVVPPAEYLAAHGELLPAAGGGLGDFVGSGGRGRALRDRPTLRLRRDALDQRTRGGPAAAPLH